MLMIGSDNLTTIMAYQNALLISLSLILLSLTAVAADDNASVMTKLADSISPVPSGWKGIDYCSWTGIKCDATNLVTSIDLSSSSISGSLPSDLNRLSQLETLTIQKNSLSGPIPSLANLTVLREVYLDDNEFSSVPPDFFTGLSGLHVISMSNNVKLEPWSIPPDLSQCGNLATFTAINANIFGSIPDIFSSLRSLQTLHLSYNNMTGPLPQSFGGSNIVYLWLNNQLKGLSGNLEVLSSMTQLSQVWLQANQFEGRVPDLNNSTNIFDLQLRDNRLTGVIPDSVMNLPKLVNISLQNNKMQGPIPVFASGVLVELGTTNSFCKETPGPCDDQVTALLCVAGAIEFPKQLAQSWLGNDACAGWFSVICDTEGRVTIVNFGKERFSGTISPAFANLTYLRSLILNDNNLTGSIPVSLTTLPYLQSLDVSNNNLSGLVPAFPLRVLVNTTGNVFLGKKINADGTVTNISKGSGVIAVVVISVVLFVAVVLFVSYRCYVKRRRQQQKLFVYVDHEKGRELLKNVNNSIESPNGLQRGESSHDHTETTIFSIQILRQLTNDFSNTNELGRGGFGVVYKGQLQDGTKIAVKRMESSMSKGMNEFHAEIGVLTKVRHRHLVALLGYCVNENEKLLVYEYMPQGNLAQHLFEYRQRGYSPLTWKQRITIALDVARGVEYLHSLAQQSFIHRDLKPANILLGDDLRAKVADFGLVKNAPDGNYSMETRLAGTFGYLAPEYANTGRVTTKIDVYSFGVILMEIMTGRKSLEEKMPDEQTNLVSWFRRVLINKEEIRKVIDESLDPDEESYDSICKVAELSGYCTCREPLLRPDMGHIVNVLSPLVDLWKPSKENEEDEEEDMGAIELEMSLSQVVRRWKAGEDTSLSSSFNGDSRMQSRNWR